MKVLIIGGVAGGASSAARLRRLDEKMDIIMFERNDYISYANCGLPYFIGGIIEKRESLFLQTPESFSKRFNIDVRVKNEVIKINREFKTVTVKNLDTSQEYEESYDKLIISTGAKPLMPDVPGIDCPKIFTLRNVSDTYKIKDYIAENKSKDAVIIGGGYIGTEIAENLSHAGLNVTIIERSDHLMATLDFDMASHVHRYLKSNGINIKLNTAATSFTKEDNDLYIDTNDTKIKADIVIMSIGVKPETHLADAAMLETSENGAIIVNEYMCTSDPDIYAVGDATISTNFVTGGKEYIPLAGPATRQGRIAADNICGIPSTYKSTQGSAIIKFLDMTIANTGINEELAKKYNLNYEKIFIYPSSSATYYPSARPMTIKLIFEKITGKVLGAQIIGYTGVDKRCDVLATAIRCGLTVYDLSELELCYSPPFSSAKDPINMVGFAAINVLEGRTFMHHWHDVGNAQKDPNIMLLDVRTKHEYDNGHIEGAINIPLDDLRNNMQSLNKNKSIWINCATGVRSYIACCILNQNGYKTSNLSGGYRLYESIYK